MKVLTEEQKKLIEKNGFLLSKYIERKSELVPDYLNDTFKSNLALKFCLSALTYNKDTGFKFSTYVYGAFNFCLHKITKIEKRNYLRNNYKDQEIIKNICDEQNEKHNSSDNIIDNELLFNIVQSAHLTNREKSVLLTYFFDGKSERETGRILEISGVRVHQLIVSITKKLRMITNNKKLDYYDFYMKKG